MAMVKPIADKVETYDATTAHIFTFTATGGAQVYKNKITIRNNSTNAVVYQDTVTSYDLSHTVPANTLTNGTYYNYTITTYDVSNNASAESDTVAFYCYATPTLTFVNIPSGNVIEASSFTFQVTYAQAQSDTLNYLRLELYDSNGQLLDSSGELISINTPPVTLSHTFSGFDNDITYGIKAICETSHGMVYATSIQTFIARYQNPSSFSLLELANDSDKGRVKLTSNTASINARMYDRDGNIKTPKYGILIHDGVPDTEWIEWETSFTPEAGSTVISEWGDRYMLDISHEGERLVWDNGINVTSTFAVQTWFYPTGEGLVGSFTNQNGDGIYVYYHIGVPYGESTEKSYIEVKGIYNHIEKVVQRSAYVDKIAMDSYCTAFVKKVGTTYTVSLEVVAPASRALLDWDDGDASTDDTNVAWDVDTNIIYEEQLTAETSAFVGIASNMDGAFPLTSVALMNGRYDNFYITKDSAYTKHTVLPTWDYNTVLACNFNGNVNGGNVAFIVSQISKIRIKRRSHGTYKWITIYEKPITSEADLHFTTYDALVPTNSEYDYALVYVMNDQSEGICIADSINTKFNGVYITDGQQTFKFMSGYVSSQYQNQPVGLLQPLNGLYPVTVSNGKTNYMSGTFSATLLGYNYEETRTIDRFNIIKQQNDYLAFLTNGRTKILKDWNGNIWMIKSSASPTVMPRQVTGNAIIDITLSWVEQGKYDNANDLYNNHFITVRN